MQCSVTQERDHISGDIKMRTLNSYKNPYRKETNLDTIVDQLCTRLQDIKDTEVSTHIGMPTCPVEQTEAVRRYYAAFPALTKGEESPQQYYLPPPAWCRKSADTDFKMQSELALSKDWAFRKKFSTGKERRNSYHGHRKNNKKRTNSYSRSFESHENLPEWMTHEGVWDIETQDPVKEFIRAIALDEGYGTCENTVTDELNMNMAARDRVPDCDDSLDLVDADWLAEDLHTFGRIKTPTQDEYAKFEAKFDRSIEALWAKQNTPDDEYQDLPIDFHELLSSPSDHMFEKAAPALGDTVWAGELRPRPAGELRPRATGERPAAGDALRSLSVLNHSREPSGFVEVGTSANPRAPRPPAPPAPRPPPPPADEDLLTSPRTHFRPILRDPYAPRYDDGATFDIRGEPDRVHFVRSESNGTYLDGERYLEYRMDGEIDYGRLRLTAAQRCPALEDPGFRLRFPLRQCDVGVQTRSPPAAAPAPADRKRRHSAARCACALPHARFLHCASLPADRPLTR